jgi:hypothetical protein
MSAPCKCLPRNADALISEIITATPQVIADTHKGLPRGFPAQVVDTILNGLSHSTKRLQDRPVGGQRDVLRCGERFRPAPLTWPQTSWLMSVVIICQAVLLRAYANCYAGMFNGCE